MGNTKKHKGTIAVLTGGGDVPGLNPAIRALTIRAINEGFRVIGFRNGWEGVIQVNTSRKPEEQEFCLFLDEEKVNKFGRAGGTFLHSSRTNPSRVSKQNVPNHLKDKYKKDINDLTDTVIENLAYLDIDYIIPFGGDDTLGYGVTLYKKGIKVIGIPKTMDNDVPGTDYCIGFSTCITRTIELSNKLRTPAGSHERFLVIEVFGRDAGYTALLPTMAGAADRCVIPEYPFRIDQLAELMVHDRNKLKHNYSSVLVSEGATFEGMEEYQDSLEVDDFSARNQNGIADLITSRLSEASKKFNKGNPIEVINQRLGYLVRSGDPDAIDSIVPMAFVNLAMNLILENRSGRLVSLRNGRYDNVPIEIISSYKKIVDIDRFYDLDKLRPRYENFEDKPLFIVTSEF